MIVMSMLEKETYPHLFFWDYKDTSIAANFTINISTPAPGSWYIGVWGYKSCTYNMKITTMSVVCPGNCSYHGTCDGVSKCNCNTDYDGDNCESKKTPLAPNEQATGYITVNNWNFFTYIPTDSSSSTIIHVQQLQLDLPLGKTGDCDLYVKRGQRPTRIDFDGLDISLSQSFYVTLPGDSRRSTIYIGIFGWGECKYSVSVNSSTSCAIGCVNGVCTADGICLCSTGFVGPRCDKVATQLASGTRANNLITASGDWNYWKFSSSKDLVVVTLKELGPASALNGLLYLYIKEGSQPTLENFDFIDIDVNKGLHSITITPSNTTTTVSNDWVIGVFGSPFLNAPLPYAIAAWETPI